MRILALDGWDGSVGVGLEIRYPPTSHPAPVSLVDPVTYKLESLHSE